MDQKSGGSDYSEPYQMISLIASTSTQDKVGADRQVVPLRERLRDLPRLAFDAGSYAEGTWSVRIALVGPVSDSL